MRALGLKPCSHGICLSGQVGSAGTYKVYMPQDLNKLSYNKLVCGAKRISLPVNVSALCQWVGAADVTGSVAKG